MNQKTFPAIDRRTLLGALGIAAAFPAHAVAVGEPVPASHGFDFLHGRWAVTHRKLRQRLAGNHDWYEFPGTLEVAPILGGRGNFDRNVLDDPAGAYEASSLRLFDAKAGAWSIWWLDARAPSIDPPVVGQFHGRKGTFFSDDTYAGQPIRVRTTYEPLASDRAQWTQAFSADRGADWEVNWIMDFRRA